MTAKVRYAIKSFVNISSILIHSKFNVGGRKRQALKAIFCLCNRTRGLYQTAITPGTCASKLE